jgi:hypothetical protein
VTDYRVDLIGSDGQIERSRTFVCDTDENAIGWAKQMVGQQPTELWSGTRLVERLFPANEKKQAVSHEVECRMVPTGKT